LNDPLVNLAYFYGAFLGDGFASAKSNSVRICSMDLDILFHAAAGVLQSEVCKIIPKIANEKMKSGKSIYRLWWFSREFAELVVSEVSNPYYKDSVPKFIWSGSQEVQLAFLSGIFDTDGNIHVQRVTPNVSVCGKKLYMASIPFICHLAGLPDISHGPSQDGMYRVAIRTRSLKDNRFNFRCTRKQNILQAWRESRGYI
jgi:hypothetical protein